MDKKNRVAILTFHMAHNYGAMLQAYALEKAINSLGCDCNILDYRFPYIDRWNGIRTKKDLCKSHGFLLGSLKYVSRCIKGYYKEAKTNIARNKYNSFMHEEMKLSKKIYESPESLADVSEYDFVVLGSDQIWNPSLTGGVAKEYFGYYFDDKKIQIVSYAASSGTNHLDDRVEKEMPSFLERLCAIGIREEGLTHYINRVHNAKAKTVIDPVFLLPADEWKELGKKSPFKKEYPYLLIYAFQTSEYIYDIAKQISKERGLKIISICYEKKANFAEALQLTDCGPLDFVALFQNADFICTTSFHGVAFSVIFGKNFYCVGHPMYSQRTTDLLASLGLSSRILYEQDGLIEATDINYDDSVCKKNTFINSSKDFLISALKRY